MKVLCGPGLPENEASREESVVTGCHSSELWTTRFLYLDSAMPETFSSPGYAPSALQDSLAWDFSHLPLEATVST